MTTWSVRLLALLMATSFNSASAQSLPLVLPSADGTVCEFVAANAGHRIAVPKEYLAANGGFPAADLPLQDMLVKRAATDIDGDGDVELLDTFRMGRREQSTVYGLSSDYAFHGPLVDVDPQEDLRWAESDGWLYFRDYWHLVQFKDRARNLALAVTTYGKSGAVFACKFDPGYREEQRPSGQPAIDAAFGALKQREQGSKLFSAFDRGGGGELTANDRGYLATLPGGFKTDVDTLYGQRISREIHIHVPTALFVADMDGDGAKERFAKLVLSSGATPPCGAVYFELLPNDGESEVDVASRDLWRSLQGVSYDRATRFPVGCGVSNSIVEIEDRGYVYTVEADAVVTARRLSRLVTPGNVLLPVAASAFVAHHDVVFDIARGGLVKEPAK